MNRNDFANVPWWKRVPTINDLECQPVHWLDQAAWARFSQ